MRKNVMNSIIHCFKHHLFFILIIMTIVVMIVVNHYPKSPEFNPNPENSLHIYQPESTYLLNKYPSTANIVKKVIHTTDHGKLILITTEHTFTYSDNISYIGKYSQNFDVEWFIGGHQGYEKDQYFLFLYDMVELSDGSYAGIGKAAQKDNLDEGDLVTVKIDQQGQIISYQLLNNLDIEGYINNFIDYREKDDSSYHIVATNDGGYTILTSTKNDINSLIVHFNESDQVKWYDTITFKTNTLLNSNQMLYDHEGNYYIYGKPYSGFNVSNIIIKLSPTGEILWKNNYEFNINRIDLVENKLYVSGSRTRGAKANLKISNTLIKLVNAYDENDYDAIRRFGGKLTAVTSEVDLDNGSVKWESTYNFNDLSQFSNYQLLKGNDDYLYSIGFINYHEPQIYIIKYDQNGNRIGETKVDLYIRGIRLEDELPEFSIEDNQIKFLMFKDREYQTINLGQVNWNYTEPINYDDVWEYQSLIHQIMWFNRLSLVLIMFLIFLHILFDDHLVIRMIRRYRYYSRDWTR